MFTMKAVKMSFDKNAFKVPVNRAKQKILREFGAYVRTVAKNMIKTGAKDHHSKPGMPPIGHDGPTRYKDFIFYVVEGDGVIVGSALLPRKDQNKMPGDLEKGGQVMVTKRVNGVLTKVPVMMAGRPHMKKAFDIAIKAKLPKLIEHSIVSA